MVSVLVDYHCTLMVRTKSKQGFERHCMGPNMVFIVYFSTPEIIFFKNLLIIVKTKER